MYYNYKILQKQSAPYTYWDLLHTREWLDVRERILDLDAGRCRECKKYATITRNGIHKEDLRRSDSIMNIGSKKEEPVHLHIHHHYYIKDKLPWQYPDDCFLTLCSDCHKKRHEKQKIVVFTDETFNEIEDMTPCKRCDGYGWLTQHAHVKKGICLRCHGYQFDELVIFHRGEGGMYTDPSSLFFD